jgi:hypothetical protein
MESDDNVVCYLVTQQITREFWIWSRFIWIFTGITAVVHFTNVQHFNQRSVFWYHFICDCSGPLLSGVFFALISHLVIWPFTVEWLPDLVHSVSYHQQLDGIEDTISNPSISCFPMQLPLAYSLLRKSHCCAKRFNQPLSSDGHYCFIPLLRKWLLRIESIIPLPLKYAFWL